MFSPRSRGPTGTYAYMAPEVYDNNVTPKVDVWALGIVAGQKKLGRAGRLGDVWVGLSAEMMENYGELEVRTWGKRTAQEPKLGW